MGSIQHTISGRRVTLGARCTIGRADECTLRLDSELASAEHAVITWSQGRWHVRDLGSSNGTFVASARARPGVRVALEQGALLRFGDARELWRLLDDAPPGARAYLLDSEQPVIADSGVLFLPDAEEPMASVFQQGEDGWMLEVDGALRGLDDQEVIEVAGARWRVELPPSTAATVATTRKLTDRPAVLDEMTLAFRVSADEEYVELALIGADRRIDLGARVHHYLLLTLARTREQAREREPEARAEHGWLYVDELADMLATDRQGVNLAVFRARKQLASAGVHNVGQLIERRSISQQIRLGVDRLRIESM